jgi:lysophospholipase L1-like esterase
MRPLFIGVILLGLFGGVATAAPGVNAPYPPPFTFTAGQAFGFIGDETVYDGRWCQYVENFFCTRYPDRKMIFYNAGVKADTAADILERLDADILERKLDYAILQLGTWDGGLDSFDPAKAHAFQLNLTALLDRIEAARILPLLMSPPPVDVRTHQERVASDDSYRFRMAPLASDYNGVLGYMTGILGDQAMQRRLRFIDAWGTLGALTSRERRVNPAFSLVPDGLLPDAGGHAVMAAAVLDALDPENARRATEILLMRGEGDPPWRSKTTGGSLSQLTGTANQVSFIWLAKSLPWAMPEAAFIGARVAGIDERFNRERLQVVGLAEGKYELLIAGEVLDTFSSDQLAVGIDLHLLWGRPEYQRAQAIAKLNEERYRSAVHPMRDLWEEVKRVRVNYPGDDARRAQVLTKVTPRLNALRNSAREQADAMYEAAKPLARNYELRRILTPEEQKAVDAAANAAAAAAPPKPNQ